MRMLAIGAALLAASSCGRLGYTALGGDGDGDEVDAGDGDSTSSGPAPLVDTGVDLGGLVALWEFEATSATDGVAFPGFPDPALVALLETNDATDVLDAGKIGSAVHLDGADDRLVVAAAAAFDLAGPHTLTAWVFMDQLPANDYGLVGKDSAYSLEVEGDTDCIDHAVYFPGSAGGFDELDPTGCALTAGAWHHLAAVFDGTEMIAYQDGVEVGRLAYTGGSVALNNNPVLIGHNTFQAGRFMNGRLDDVTIWSRALTAAEIETIERLQR